MKRYKYVLRNIFIFKILIATGTIHLNFSNNTGNFHLFTIKTKFHSWSKKTLPIDLSMPVTQYTEGLKNSISES